MATNMPTGSDNNTENTLLPSKNYSCTSCQIAFTDGQEQRTHMKTSWHLFNLKRRMASLPPVAKEEYNTDIEAQIESNQVSRRSRSRSSKASSSSSSSSEEEEDISDNEDTASPFQCLFCNQDFEQDDAGFASNLEHMRSAHGMHIPGSDKIFDMQSFVAYLATEIRTWHECLYCGATKPSTQSIQSHMRDKGHCRLNFDREPELLDFWEPRLESAEEDGLEYDEEEGEERQITLLSETEIRFASGKVVGSRHAAPSSKKPSKKTRSTPAASDALPASENAESAQSSQLTQTAQSSQSVQAMQALLEAIGPQQATSLTLSRADEQSLTGITAQQRQAVMMAVKKAQRSEAMARRAREWVYAKGANNQKFDQLDSSKMKWGKQNHKLLPR
ncbi:hypothetical protein IQ07DRAFT_513605 [Pyrenochaeta sp. DS3sAY3a]|nr:hypothetical protein IQ07DRAFT_513605 [Pyrenochaeta sp. DS3sAY3a]